MLEVLTLTKIEFTIMDVVFCQTGVKSQYRAFSYDVMSAAILVFQNKEMVAILVYQAIPPGIKIHFDSKIVFV